MATKTNNEPWAVARERFKAAGANLQTVAGEAQKVEAALRVFEWAPGESTLPLLDLERQQAMLAPKVKAARLAADRAQRNLWASDSPAVAEGVARLLDGAFLDGAPATAHYADPGDDAERVGFAVIQSIGHEIEPNGSARGRVTVKVTGPKWARQSFDHGAKLAVVDFLHLESVRFMGFGGSREVAIAWGDAGLNVELIAWPERPFVGVVPTGPMEGAEVGGAWSWERFAPKAGLTRVETGVSTSTLVREALAGGSHGLTVTGFTVDGGVRTTELDLVVIVAEVGSSAVEIAKTAVDAMAGRGIIPGVGRVTGVAVATEVEPYERPDFGGNHVTRGFRIRAKLTAEGTVL